MSRFLPFEIWQWFVAIISILVGILTAGHAVVFKRDPRSAILWLQTFVILPIIGSALYLFLGINRYQRRARGWRSVALTDGDSYLSTDSVPPSLKSLSTLVGRATSLNLTEGNRIEPLVGGAQAYPAMLDAIEGAQHSIALSTYIFDRKGIGERFIQALTSAHRRGVKVRVLIDDVHVRLSLNSAFRALADAGISVASFNSTLVPARLHAFNLRNHRKILVVDGVRGFSGGMNIQASYWRQESPEKSFRDLHFQIAGPVVNHLRIAFSRDWLDTTGEELDDDFWSKIPPQKSSTGTTCARGIEAGPDETLDRMRWVFLGALSSAQHTVRIWTPYFLPDPSLLSAISTALLRGVRVEILTPAQGDHRIVSWAAQAHYWQVLENGGEIFLRKNPFDHTKLMLVDGQWACIGSANWDARSLRLNFEFNVELYDQELCRTLEKLFVQARGDSYQLKSTDLVALPFPVKLRNGIARLFSPVL